LIPQSELDHLADLLKDFATKNHYTPEAAFSIIRTRYIQLEKSNFIPEICSKINNMEKSKLPNLFKIFANIIHHVLYRDILTNAGKYRQINDPKKGSIFFGGVKQRSLESKFHGISADQIENEIIVAFKWLGNDGDPVENALRFYQHFVYIHPYYDANGRIARFIMIIHLLLHKLSISKIPFDQSKGKFLKKLNRCHERFGTDKSEKYFKYFFQFMKKYITPINLNANEC